MLLFINEHSLDGQFPDGAAFEGAIRTVNTILGRVLDLESDRKVHFSHTGLGKHAIRQHQFCRSLHLLPDRTMRITFKQLLLDKLGATNWNSLGERCHSGDDLFEWQGNVVTEMSPAELADRRIAQPALIGLLLNFKDSNYAGLEAVQIAKNDRETTNLDCCDDIASFQAFLTRTGIRFLNYEFAIGIKPTTRQTILAREHSRFRRTKRWSGQSTRIYEENETRHLWYLDSFHTGTQPHFEVFDRNGVHLGEADWRGNLLPGTSDVTKKI
ncbi:MAG: hypothetical protein QOH24_625 [Verrucomicrobiota bacterium]|jgi:hypothetical protein